MQNEKRQMQNAKETKPTDRRPCGPYDYQFSSQPTSPCAARTVITTTPLKYLAMTDYQDRVDQLRRTPVSGAMVVWLSSLMLGGPFAVAWLLDDGNGNQPFPKGLRALVLIAAALHVGSIAYRLAQAARAREPVWPVARNLLSGYLILAATADIAWRLRGFGIFALLDYILLTGPLFLALRNVTLALKPATRSQEDDGGPGS